MGRFHRTLEKFRSFVYRGVFNVSLGMLFCSPRQRGRVSSAASVFHLFTPTCLSSRQVDEESQTRDPSCGGSAQTLGERDCAASGTATHLVQNFPVTHFQFTRPSFFLQTLDSLFVLCDWQCGPINLTGIVTTCGFSFAGRLTRPEGPERLEMESNVSLARKCGEEIWGGCYLWGNCGRFFFFIWKPASKHSILKWEHVESKNNNNTPFPSFLILSGLLKTQLSGVRTAVICSLEQSNLWRGKLLRL